jgi:hypothetical protein
MRALALQPSLSFGTFFGKPCDAPVLLPRDYGKEPRQLFRESVTKFARGADYETSRMRIRRGGAFVVRIRQRLSRGAQTAWFDVSWCVSLMNSVTMRFKDLHAKMRNVGVQWAISLAAFDRMRYRFCHNAVLRPIRLELRAAFQAPSSMSRAGAYPQPCCALGQ